jgi:hypothetical protein
LDELYTSLNRVLEIKERVNWVPIPNASGPEFGASGAKLFEQGTSSNLTKLDKSILDLKIRQFNATYQRTAVEDLGSFASPFDIHINDESVEKITNELKNNEHMRDSAANKGFIAMGRIELIMGEASGLGLIDILAVYIALWSMNEEALISMLDEESFNRLSENFPTLLVGAAADRFGSTDPPKNIIEALSDFELKFRNVLDFAQREFNNKFKTDGQIDGGDVSQDD